MLMNDHFMVVGIGYLVLRHYSQFWCKFNHFFLNKEI